MRRAQQWSVLGKCSTRIFRRCVSTALGKSPNDIGCMHASQGISIQPWQIDSSVTFLSSYSPCSVRCSRAFATRNLESSLDALESDEMKNCIAYGLAVHACAILSGCGIWCQAGPMTCGLSREDTDKLLHPKAAVSIGLNQERREMYGDKT